MRLKNGVNGKAIQVYKIDQLKNLKKGDMFSFIYSDHEGRFLSYADYDPDNEIGLLASMYFYSNKDRRRKLVYLYEDDFIYIEKEVKTAANLAAKLAYKQKPEEALQILQMLKSYSIDNGVEKEALIFASVALRKRKVLKVLTLI